MNAANGDGQQIELYWRPGCGYCSSLRRGLDKLGIERVEHNIWDEPGGVDIVRLHANGNETVPTVVLGDVGLVNPSVAQVIALLAERAPHLLPNGVEAPQPGRVSRFVGRVLGS